MIDNRQQHPFSSLENILLILFSLPVIVFIAGWFHLPAALLAVLGLILVLRRALYSQGEGCAIRDLSAWDWGLIVLAAVLWVSLSGTGGIGFQNWDHEKHNAMLNDLVRKDWPVRYESGRLLLVYYLPYYLIPAAVGKAAGWAAANFLLWLQLLLFVALTLAWLAKRVEARGRLCVLAAVLLFVYFSGCDWVGIAYEKGPPGFPAHIEWWTRFNYLSITSQLFWVPNSAVASWVGTALFLDALERRSLLRSFLVWLLTLFWCPYAAAGMLPFLLVLRASAVGWKEFLCTDWKWAFGAFPALVLAIAFYTSKSASIPLEAAWMHASDIRGFAIDYIKLLGLHVLWAVPFLWYFKRKIGIGNELWRLFLIACGVLVVLPVSIAPGISDFIMKASMPPILAFALVFIAVIIQFLRAPQGSPSRSRRSRLVMSILMVIYLVGSLTAVHEIGRSILRYQARTPGFCREDCLPALKPDYVYRQYTSEGNSLLRLMLRDSVP